MDLAGSRLIAEDVSLRIPWFLFVVLQINVYIIDVCGSVLLCTLMILLDRGSVFVSKRHDGHVEHDDDDDDDDDVDVEVEDADTARNNNDINEDDSNMSKGSGNNINGENNNGKNKTIMTPVPSTPAQISQQQQQH